MLKFFGALRLNLLVLAQHILVLREHLIPCLPPEHPQHTLTPFQSQAVGQPHGRAVALASPAFLLQCTRVQMGKEQHCGNQMPGNTCGRRKPLVEMQSSDSHAAEQGSQAVPAASW